MGSIPPAISNSEHFKIDLIFSVSLGHVGVTSWNFAT